jgi:hypothetical protein
VNPRHPFHEAATLLRMRAKAAKHDGAHEMEVEGLKQAANWLDRLAGVSDEPVAEGGPSHG